MGGERKRISQTPRRPATSPSPAGGRRLAGRGLAAVGAGLVLCSWIAVPARAGEVSQVAAATPALTLAEVVTRALAADPGAASAQGDLRVAEAARRSAKGAFAPDLTLSSGAALSGEIAGGSLARGGTRESYSAGLSSGYELYSGGRRGAELELSRAGVDASLAGLVQRRSAVALAAKQAFFRVLRDNELIRVTAARLERARQGLAAAESRVRVGSATRSDVLRAQLELNQARQATLSAEAERTTADYALGRIAGIDGPVTARAEPLTAAREPSPPIAALEAPAELASPAVRRAENALRSATLAITAARADYRPVIRAAAGTGWSSTGLADGGNGNWSVQTALSLPLFDGHQRSSAVERAEANRATAEAELADIRRATRAELARILAAISVADQKIVLAEQALAVAQEDLRVQYQRYELGVSTILDRLTSQAALVVAETDLVGARFDFELARAELDALLGKEM
ncbi:MAG: TolC family protein [Candidatus Schekmanbacteria bacterium]|nr:TolC family protein [Candidatus Schekmanbacteria bacterium]